MVSKQQQKQWNHNIFMNEKYQDIWIIVYHNMNKV